MRIQIYAAICTYCLVAIIESKMKLDRHIYEVLQMLGGSLLVKEPLVELLSLPVEMLEIAKTNIKN